VDGPYLFSVGGIGSLNERVVLSEHAIEAFQVPTEMAANLSGGYEQLVGSGLRFDPIQLHLNHNTIK